MPKKTVRELEAELRSLKAQLRSKKTTTRLKNEISETKHKKHAASFAELVGKFRRAGMGFGAAARRASKEYRKAHRKYGGI